MRLSAIFASTLALAAHAAPSSPKFIVKGMAKPDAALNAMSDYMDLMAIKVQTARSGRAPPGCDFSKAEMPLNGLPAPAAGLTVRHIALGHGTQNYTCDAGNSTAIPVAVGALATLYNVSCIAVRYPDLAQMMPAMAVNFDIESIRPPGFSFAQRSGRHFFPEADTPFFDLDTPSMDIGEAPCAKNSSSPAPATAAVNREGSTAVPWLRLTTKNGATENIREVFRVNTAGGNPPATCEGQPATLEVPYSAMYWFWEGPAN